MVSPFKFNIIQFRDGKYGVRRFNILAWRFEFLDVTPGNDFWVSSSSIEAYCKGTKDQALIALNEYSPKSLKRDYGKLI